MAGDASPPIDASTRFNLGSASKMFTSVAIGQLINGGKLQLDEPVGRIVSGLSAGATAPLRPAPGATEGYGSPAGGLFSTAEDMHRFATALITGKLLPRAIADEFTSPQVESAPAANGQSARHYGFGFAISDRDGLRWFGHGGGTLGANSEFSIEPKHQWVISVLSNRDPPTATNIMRKIRALLTDSAHSSGCSAHAS